MEIKLNCFSCSQELIFNDSVARRDECFKCRADVHVCKNCEFYDPKVYNACRETSAEVVQEKERANYCEYFSPRKGGVGVVDPSIALKAAAEALFKKK